MSNTNTGGPAFPGPYANENWNIEVLFKQHGMTMRDYFAAKAMQGMLAENGGGALRNDTLADYAYEVADAMLKAREA